MAGSEMVVILGVYLSADRLEMTPIIEKSSGTRSPLSRTPGSHHYRSVHCLNWNVSDEYLFGPDLLVAPVMEAGLTQRQVYLPDGTQWTDAWTGEVLAGGQTITVDAPLDIIPLFVRDGANLPTW
jgi:hypothetical protein